MKSLLHKNMAQFVACIVVVLVLATPIFYFLTRWFYSEDLYEVIENVRKGTPIPVLDLERDVFEGVVIQFVIIFVVLSISLLIMMRFATKRLWKPFDDTLKKMELFNLEQNKEPKFEATDIEEFNRLNQSLLQLVRRDMNMYNARKEFAENASHELQTPIAIFQGKLDMLMQEPMNESQAHIVEDLYLVSKRMSRLNRNILLLAKIDNKQFDEMERFDALACITEGVEFYRNLKSENSIILTDNCGGTLMLDANKSLFDSLLYNLMMNAIRHSCDGKAEILVSKNSVAVSNCSNEGALDENLLFHRFCSISSKNRGNGLGLSIAKAICVYHNWNISYKYSEGKHHFSVDF